MLAYIAYMDVMGYIYLIKLVVWNKCYFGTNVIFPLILGMSSSQLTNIFRGVGIPPTSNCPHDMIMFSLVHYIHR